MLKNRFKVGNLRQADCKHLQPSKVVAKRFVLLLRQIEGHCGCCICQDVLQTFAKQGSLGQDAIAGCVRNCLVELLPRLNDRFEFCLDWLIQQVLLNELKVWALEDILRKPGRFNHVYFNNHED